MYWRYFFWNFVGRASDTQDAPWISGLAGEAETEQTAYESVSERMARNVYFGLPLLLGLLGMAFHFSRDWRRALAVLALFLITGVGIVLYLNQTPNQPRERDYSYVASFFAFTLWVGIGATGLIEAAESALAKRTPGLRRAAGLAVAGVAFAAGPAILLAQNYDDHDRSGNRLPTDFAWNLLQSTAPNAILFTNGDNDTYPLWYLQEVMGVRPDVRVVNLSLLNTDWYVRQLKNQWSRESAPLPMTMSDQRIASLLPMLEYQPREFSLPTPDGGSVRWNLTGQPSPYGGGLRALFVSDLTVLDIITANAANGWTRPIYFSSTVAESSELGLQPFMQNEGLARRVMPFETNAGPDGRVAPDVFAERLPHYRFRNLTDTGVYYDENARGLADVYNRTMGTAAAGLVAAGDTALARETLRRITTEIAPEVIPPSFYSSVVLAQALGSVGDEEAMARTIAPAEREALALLQSAATEPQQARALQYVRILQAAYLDAEAYQAASAFYDRLATAVGDPTLRMSAEDIRAQAESMRVVGEPPGVDSGASEQ
jgi:hypothetical protein